MSSFKSFEEIEAWQKARKLAKPVYLITQRSLFNADKDLRYQARRAVTSISLNIAEGFEREGTKEFLNFLSYAKGSAGEIRSLSYTLLDLEFINENEFKELRDRSAEISRMIGGLMKYLRSTKIKGSKYKTTGKDGKPDSKTLN